MRKQTLLYVFVSAYFALAVSAQPSLQRGDLLVATKISEFDNFGNEIPTAILQVFGADGTFKRTLGTYPGREFADLFYREGVIYVAARYPDAIERIDASGNLLSPFTTDVRAINYISPGPNGGLLAVNGSEEIYQFAADGSLVRFRNALSEPPGGGGIDLAADQCVVFYAVGGTIVRWDACLDTPAAAVTTNLSSYTFGDIRLLPDGTFLIDPASGQPVIHLSATGTILREYGAFGGNSVALDVDGQSFWTTVGVCHVRRDIATGAVLATSDCLGGASGLAVVGEPRAGLPPVPPTDPESIPVASVPVLAALATALAMLALMRLRLA